MGKLVEISLLIDVTLSLATLSPSLHNFCATFLFHATPEKISAKKFPPEIFSQILLCFFKSGTIQEVSLQASAMRNFLQGIRNIHQHKALNPKLVRDLFLLRTHN